ncbi:hypothetical protein KA005_58405 [bacterium]|nr:hypothetical protein [bacterium]
MIHNKEVMDTKAKEYENNPEFLEFVNREFNRTAVDATIEELAEFAIGGFDEAVKAFEEQKEKNES